MKQATLIVLLITLFGLTNNLGAQTNKQAQPDPQKQKLLQDFKQNKALRNQNLRAEEENRMKEKSVAVQTNKYNHHEADIFAKLNTETIPDDFPVYKAGYTDEQYVILMNKWYAAHPSLLKKETTNEQK
jgi:hypothetical protein